MQDAPLGASPILVYDGDCGFCSACVRLIRRRIHPGVRAVPWQRTDLSQLGATRQQAERAVLWVSRDGSIHAGAMAIAHLLLDAGAPWAQVGAAIRIPPIRWFAAGTYRLVARNRHRLPGGTPSCGR